MVCRNHTRTSNVYTRTCPLATTLARNSRSNTCTCQPCHHTEVSVTVQPSLCETLRYGLAGPYLHPARPWLHRNRKQRTQTLLPMTDPCTGGNAHAGIPTLAAVPGLISTSEDAMGEPSPTEPTQRAVLNCEDRTHPVQDPPGSSSPPPTTHHAQGASRLARQHPPHALLTRRRWSLSVLLMNTPQMSHTVIVRSGSVSCLCRTSYCLPRLSACLVTARAPSTSPSSPRMAARATRSAGQQHSRTAHCSCIPTHACHNSRLSV
jgi:hypothetical protein